MPSVIVVNGARVVLPDGARDVRIANGEVTVGGTRVSSGLSGVVEVKWEGPLCNLTSDASVSVTGSVEGDVEAGGSVSCHGVGGSVDAGGSVDCGTVTGDVDAGGSVRCGSVGGSVDAGGSVRHG